MASMPVDQSQWWVGLHKLWDESALLRERMRNHENLLMPHPKCQHSDPGREDWIDRSVFNIRFNKEVLIPAMRMWSLADPEHVPQVEYLNQEIAAFFQLHKRTDKGEGEVHFNCWNLRKLMTMAKAQCSKNNPPQDSQLQIYIP